MDRRHFLRSALATAVAASLPTGRALAAAFHALSQVVSEILAVSPDGREITLSQSAVQDFADSLRGQLLLPGSEGYDTARRVWNASIDKYPALIARCTGASDVARAVDFARGNDLLVAVKCGGHSFSGQSTCDRGLLIDLAGLRGVRVDPYARRMRVAGGSLLGAMDEEAMSFGLVTTAGTVSHTGVGGLTTGGGFGRVARRFGLALDNVRAADVIAADGKLYRASPEENPDLYWGVRGGGGNFGVVTSFEFALHPMERTVIGGDIVFPIAQARQILEFYADYSVAAPDDLYLDFTMVQPPGEEDGVVIMDVCYSGQAGRAEQALAPIRKAGSPLADNIKAVDYVALQKSGDSSDPRAVGTYLKSGFTREITPALIDDILEGFGSHPRRTSLFFFQHSGGAISRVPADATAFVHRDAQHVMFTLAAFDPATDPSEHFADTRRYWATLEPHTKGWYVNEIADESLRTVRSNYGGNYERLVAVKNRFDPTNMFRRNANVAPATGARPARG